MKFFSNKRNISILVAVTFGLSYGAWDYYIGSSPDNLNSKQNRTNAKMTYGHFLDYLDQGWIKSVDLFENGRSAIVVASSPELGDRPQRVRVDIPVGASGLIVRLRENQIDFTAHPTFNFEPIFTVLGNFLLPLIIIVGLFFLFRRSSNVMNMMNGGGPGQVMGFRKSGAKVQMDVNTDTSFADVAGIDEAKEEFEEVVTFLKYPQRFTSVGAKIPKGVILIGPPGTGKTLLAKAIAGEAGVPFISISGSEFVEMFVGVGASRVRDLFKTAQQNSPCIVFIDEIDAVGRQRGTGVGGGNDEREQTLNQILTEMDGFKGNTGVIVIAATNRVDVLDSALLRPGRFDRQVNVNLPDVKGRTEILKVHASNKKFNPNVSLERIAQRTPGFSGADLSNLLNEAAILTARKMNIGITMLEINTAIDRVVAGLERTTLTDTRNKRLIAYHEVGHALIGTLLKNHDDVEKVTLIPRGQARGLTWFTANEDQMLVSRAQLVARIMGTLGGRAAEEVIFGTTEITTGASNDLQQVTNLARQMVTRFGMSTVGPLALESPNSSQVFLGRSIRSGNQLSSPVADKVDQQVKEIVGYCYEQAVNLIKTNRFVIDQLVDKLIAQETIEGDEFRKYVNMYAKLSETV